MNRLATILVLAILFLGAASARAVDPVEVEGQPLAANVDRLIQAQEFLGSPFPEAVTKQLKQAIDKRDAIALQKALDPLALVVVTINPESRVKSARGPARAVLQQNGYTPLLIKVVNDSPVTAPLNMTSPQAGPIYSRDNDKIKGDLGRFLDVEIFNKSPMTGKLSGLKVEYVVGLIYSKEAGKREATLGFDVGQGTQDLGFRGEVPVLFDIRPAIAVKLKVLDFDSTPTVGRFTFRDKLKRVYPSRIKRLAPDFFFQDQIYRKDGGTVLLPPGELEMEYGRGPEYRQLKKKVVIPEKGPFEIAVKLDRWIHTDKYGFYSGDHHIHAAGCQHYTNPTEGVFPEDMYLHVKGEGLNVGCNLTWGPCFDFQRQFFQPHAHPISEPFTVLRYDIEVSGFGSQALGHVCLLNLKDQTYPGSDGLKTKGWPTWTTPLMKWAKKQGAYTGYAHSASGLNVNSGNAAKRLLFDLDADKDGKISREEAAKGKTPLPMAFDLINKDQDTTLSAIELANALDIAKVKLPNLAVPELDGIGAQEIFVTAAQGLCDFISAMDTNRVQEWNCWYHIMNCGFPLKASGETDFPCISGSRVGEGRVYVQLGKVDKVDYATWCDGLAKGKSYVSDGYGHALIFEVEGKKPSQDLELKKPGKVHVKARVSFAKEMPLGTAKGGQLPTGDTRAVELIVNGKPVAVRQVPADDELHDLSFTIEVDRSSWVALRHMPMMHTNPVNVIVGGQPIRASRSSALWCAACIEQLWRARARVIAEAERGEAQRTFDAAILQYRKIAQECPEGS